MTETYPDGVLAVHPNIKDSLAIAFPLDSIEADDVELLMANGPDSQIELAGRSAAGQLGVNVIRAAGAIVISQENLHVPAGIEAYTSIARSMVEDIGELQSVTRPGKPLKWEGEDIKFGRLVNYNNLRRLDKDEVERAVRDRLIAFDPLPQASEKPAYTVNENGSVSLPLSLLEFVFNESRLSRPELRFNALHHGRAGLIPHMDTLPRESDDVLPGFMVGGTVFSPGPYYVKIREFLDKDGKVRQLPSAALFDGNRLMGVDPRHDPYSRNRQVELVNNGSKQTFGDTLVTIDIFRSTQVSETLHPVVDWRGMSPQERLSTHNNGVSPLDVIKAADPTSREFLLNPVAGPDTGAMVISSHGISTVKRGRTPLFMSQNILYAAASFGRYRDIPEGLEHLKPFVEALKPAADRSRLLVADELEPKHIPNIIKSGDIRALLMRRYLGSGVKGVAMTKEDHSAIVDLVRQGVSIAWENEGDLRELHRSGLWMTPEAADGIGELDLVIAMYGSHFEELSTKLEPGIDSLFKELTEILPVENIGVTHGNMAGVMALADRLARKHGIMSLGVGLDLSHVGQNDVNLLPDGFLFMESYERLYRQEKLDKFNTISIFNAGGYGTLEEFYITVCSEKLSSRLPAPLLLVAPDQLFDNAKQLVDDIAAQGYGQKWVGRTIELVENYEQAIEVIKDFWEDPKAYWKKAGLSKEEITTASRNHELVLEQMGMRLADNLKKAAATYEG